LGFWGGGLGCEVEIKCMGFRVSGSGFGVWGSGLRVKGLGFRFFLQGSGFGVWGSGLSNQYEGSGGKDSVLKVEG
jgi:hypothetical protein